MPVKKVDDHWEVNGEDYDTEAKANAAYQASLALHLDVPQEKKKTKKASKKKSKKDDEDDEAEEE